MSIDQVLRYNPLPTCEMEAAEAIKAAAGESDPYFAIIIAIAYGVILGKRQDRARRKGKHHDAKDARKESR